MPPPQAPSWRNSSPRRPRTERDAGGRSVAPDRPRTAPSCGGRREAPPLSHALCVVHGARCLATRCNGLPQADPRPRARLHQRQGPADARSGAQAKRSLTRRPLSMLTRAATPLWPHSSLTPAPPARRATPSSTSSSSTTSSRNGSCCDGRLGRACWYAEPRPLSRCSGKVEAGKLTRTVGTTTHASCTAASLVG